MGPCVSIIRYAPLAYTDLVVERKRRMQQVTREDRVTKFVKLQMLRDINVWKHFGLSRREKGTFEQML